MITFSSKINSEIQIDRTKGIIGRKLRFSIIIRMDDSTHARIPSGIVPYYSKSSYTIQVDIPETEVHDVEMFTFGIRGRLVVGKPHRERGIEKPILGEHPVISIATTYIDITILHLRKHQATVYLSLLSRRNTLVQAIINKLGELVPIHFQFVLVYPMPRSMEPALLRCTVLCA